MKLFSTYQSDDCDGGFLNQDLHTFTIIIDLLEGF